MPRIGEDGNPDTEKIKGGRRGKGDDYPRHERIVENGSIFQSCINVKACGISDRNG